MTLNKNVIIVLTALALIALTVAVRLTDHLPNMTPVIAVGLVAGAYLGRSYGYLVPLAALFISDLVLGFYDWRIMASVYGSFALVGLSGYLMRKFRGVQSYALLAIGGSTFFFLFTNAAVWAFSAWYPKTLSGLLYAYEMGIPFWRNMVFGDILYTATLVGACELAILLYAKYQLAHKTALVTASIK